MLIDIEITCQGGSTPLTFLKIGSVELEAVFFNFFVTDSFGFFNGGS
jgi:hypothetical protein